MQLDPNDLLWFARVVTEGSFSRAADRLAVPKSTLSRRISALEATLGERLLLRTTRKLVVTDFGQSVLAHAQQVTSEVEATLALTQQRQVQPSGRLRVSMPADIANDTMTSMIARYLRQYPAVSLELDLSARRVDLIGENFDLAVRIGSLPDDASLAARRLAVFANSLYASPSYVQQNGLPQEPEQLMEHQSLCLFARNGEAALWHLVNGEQSWQGQTHALATANSPLVLKRLALEGMGIALLAPQYALCEVRQGSLVRILPDWKSPDVTAWAVFPGRRLMPSRTRLFIDALVEEFASVLDPRHGYGPN